jgi:hypothetical protein
MPLIFCLKQAVQSKHVPGTQGISEGRQGGIMVALFGIFLAKLLSIAGIGGLIAGLFAKKWAVAAGLGVALGIVDTLLLASIQYTDIAPISWAMAIIVAVLMATLGWWCRGRRRAHALSPPVQGGPDSR